MAGTDVERLVVSLEASITKYDRAMQRAVTQTNRTARQIESRFDRTAAQVENRFDRMGRGMGTSFVALQRGLAGAFAGAAALRGAQQLIDASTRIENALKVAGLEGQALTNVYDDLFASAQRNSAPIESLVQLFSRVSIVQNELGVSTEELTRFTDNVALALRVAGTDAQGASGALLQLSQALGGGVVRAEEFTSIQEGALPVLQAVAAGLEEAGGSVSRLRGLVIDGRVSSEAFFRAFEAGAGILEQRVAGAETTISGQFVRLQNVLIDTAGKFDNATGASASFGEGLEAVTDLILELQAAAESVSGPVQGLIYFLENGLKDYALQLREASGFGDFADPIIEAIAETALGLQQVSSGAEQVAISLSDVAGVDAMPPALRQELADLIAQLNAVPESAGDTVVALEELGSLHPDFSGVYDGLLTIINHLHGVQTQASAAADALSLLPGASGPSRRGGGRGVVGTSPVNPDGSPIPLPRPEGLVGGGVASTPITLADYPITGTGGSGGGGGGGGQNPQQRFEEALAATQRQIDLLNQETALRATLNPLIDDHGFAMEKLRVQQELLNEAEQAGLEITPERLAAINELADGMAQASVAAAQLEEQQQAIVETVETLGGLTQDVVGSFITDMRNGASAADALNNALGRIADQLIQMALNGDIAAFLQNLVSAFTGNFGGGAVKTGGKAPGFATGTANTGGVRGEPRGIVHGQEAVIPLPNGGKVPVKVMGGMGQVVLRPETKIINNAGVDVSERTVSDGRGGYRQEIVIDKMVAGAMSRTGGQAQRATKAIGRVTPR